MGRLNLRKIMSSGLAFFFVTPGPSIFSMQIHNLNRRTGELSMGGGFGQVGPTSIAFVALLSADDFFLRLRRKETAHGLEYWDGSQRVTKFPPELTVRVLAYLGTRSDSGDAITPSPEAAIHDLQWSAVWKTGMKTRRATNLEVTEAECSPEELEKRTGLPLSSNPFGTTHEPKLRAIWMISLNLHQQDAPLTDSLVVTVMTSNGKQITRFSGHL